MAQSSQQRSSSSRSKGSVNGALLGSIFLGICILIAGFNIGGNLKKVNKTLSEQTFSDSNTYNAPSDLTYAEKKYVTEDEAAAYLNLSTQQVVDLINAGEIAEYVKTDSGYSISVSVLDAWFENAAYQNKLNAANAAASSNPSSEE